MGSSILIVEFEEERMAEKALDTLDDMHMYKLYEIAKAVVINKDLQGNTKVWNKGELTPRLGAISGGISGLVIGALVDCLIGGLLGAAAGAIAGKATDLGIPNEKFDEISDHMENASSTLILVLKSGDPEKIAAALEKTGGKTIELTISNEVQEEMEKRLSDSGDV